MAAFADVISQKVGVSKQDVTIGSAEKHDDSNPVAKAHAEAKAKKEAQLKKLNAAVEETKTAENKDKADPETAKKDAENAKADASQESAENKVKAKEGVLLEVGAGSVDVRFTISNIEASKAEKLLQMFPASSPTTLLMALQLALPRALKSLGKAEPRAGNRGSRKLAAPRLF